MIVEPRHTHSQTKTLDFAFQHVNEEQKIRICTTLIEEQKPGAGGTGGLLTISHAIVL